MKSKTDFEKIDSSCVGLGRGGTVINIHVFLAPRNDCAFKNHRSQEGRRGRFKNRDNSLIIAEQKFSIQLCKVWRRYNSDNVIFIGQPSIP